MTYGQWLQMNITNSGWLGKFAEPMVVELLTSVSLKSGSLDPSFNIVDSVKAISLSCSLSEAKIFALFRLTRFKKSNKQ